MFRRSGSLLVSAIFRVSKTSCRTLHGTLLLSPGGHDDLDDDCDDFHVDDLDDDSNYYHVDDDGGDFTRDPTSLPRWS